MALSELRKTIGQYQVEEVLGHGGMATVYRAVQPELERTVAIKVLLPAYLNDAVFRARFQREARLIARLRHPHIVGIYDVAEDDGLPFLVMEYLEGKTLHAALVARRQHGQLFSAHETLLLLTPLADALDYAHGRGVIHRDLKPENIILTPNGPVITDFGLARLVQEENDTVSVVMGTPAYMAPEQIEAQPIDPRTDVYALGILLYELLTGSVPFSGPSPVAVARAHLTETPPSFASLNPRLHIMPEVEEVAFRAIAKRKEDRWPSAGAMVEALQHALEHAVPAEQETSSVAVAPVTPQPRQPVPPRQQRRLQRPPDLDTKISRLVLLLPLLALLFGGLWGIRSFARGVDTQNPDSRSAAIVASVAPTPTEQSGLVDGPGPTPTLVPVATAVATVVVPDTAVPLSTDTAVPSSTAPPATTETLTPEPTPDTRVRAAVRAPLGAYLRGGPGTDYPIIGGIADNTLVTATGQSDGWLQIVTDANEQGWVVLAVLEINNGDIAALPWPEVTPPPPPLTATPVPVPPSATPVPLAPPVAEQPAPPIVEQPVLPTPLPEQQPAPPPPTATAAPPPPQAPPAVAGATIRLEDTNFVGGFRNRGASIYGGRTATWVYGQGTTYSTMSATFSISEPRSGTVVLLIEGMDSENVAKTPVRIAVNDVVLFQGPTPFPNDDLPLETGVWATQRLEFDASILRAGNNSVSLTNLASGTVGLPPFVAVDYAVIQLP